MIHITNLVTSTITLPGVVQSAGPCVISPDGSTLWVGGGGNTGGYVIGIDINTNLVIATVGPFSSIGLFDLAITPNGQYLYATCINDDFLYAINTSTNVVTNISTAPLGAHYNSFWVTITPDGLHAYVSFGNTQVAILTIATNTFGSFLSFDSDTKMVISPDGSSLYTGVSATGDVYVISTVTNTVTHTISALVREDGAITPDGSQVYFVGNDLIAVNTTTFIPTTITGVGSNPFGVCVGASGQFVYVSSSGSGGGNGSIYVISTSTNTIVHTIALPQNQAYQLKAVGGSIGNPIVMII